MKYRKVAVLCLLSAAAHLFGLSCKGPPQVRAVQQPKPEKQQPEKVAAKPLPARALLNRIGHEEIAWDKVAWEKFKKPKRRVSYSAPRNDGMDYGPFLSATVHAKGPGDNTTLKGIAIKLGGNAAVLFDTELLRYSAGWTDGFLDLNGVAFNGNESVNPTVWGAQKFATRPGPGWANARGSFVDPRPIPHGPLPRDWAKYKGLYKHGNQVILSYTVGDCDVLEMPGIYGFNNHTTFVRVFEIGRSSRPLTLRVCDVVNATGWVGAFGQTTGEAKAGNAKRTMAVLVQGETCTAARLVGAPRRAAWQIVDDSRIQLYIPAEATPTSFELMLWNGPRQDLPRQQFIVREGQIDLRSLTRGGPAQWPKPVVTRGKLGTGDGPYVVDTITAPYRNPWGSRMRFGGLDFFSDGRAALCTWNGDVWVVSGIDDKLKRLTWKRFAAGLYQTLGLKIVDDVIYTTGRDQITRLHDLNGDGEADFYENFNNDCLITRNSHEFAFDLQTDREGNFYFTKSGPIREGGRGFEKIVPHHGSLFRVSKDGKKFDVVATGFRSPNGISVGPGGELTSGDNEGTWMPRCPINWIKPGGFYGVVDLAHRPKRPTRRDNPLCWLPKSVDNSGGGQVWVTSNRWGPFQGDLLHMSYGECSLFKVFYEHVGEEVQGGVVKFPLRFITGIMRGRFNQRDGQLYLCGLRGWQTSAPEQYVGGFQRVRYTGKPVHLPTALHATKRGLFITFTSPLDPATAGDPDNYSIRQWNYRWTSSYGSPEMSVTNPRRRGQDRVRITAAGLSADRKTVFLKVPGIRTVMQMRIRYRIKAADGTALRQKIYNTINRLGPERSLADFDL